jgi:hypothetical protein
MRAGVRPAAVAVAAAASVAGGSRCRERGVSACVAGGVRGAEDHLAIAGTAGFGDAVAAPSLGHAELGAEVGSGEGLAPLPGVVVGVTGGGLPLLGTLPCRPGAGGSRR